jgi:hypothetical protein
MNNIPTASLCSSYYQAHVKRELCWFVAATLRSFEHLAFDRTLDTETSLFEFFVSPSTENYFLEIMSFYQEEGLINNLVKLPNRLADLNQQA